MEKETERRFSPTKTRGTLTPVAGATLALTLLIGSADQAAAKAITINDGTIPHSQRILQEFETRGIEIELEEGNILRVEGPKTPNQDILRLEQEQFEAEQKILAEKAEEERKIAEQAATEAEAARKAEEERKAAQSKQVSNGSVSAQSITGGGISAFITGYYCEYDSGYRGDGGGFCGHMASGKTVYDGAAACGSNFMHGSTYYIEGYGKIVCEDTGQLASNQIDIWTMYSSGLSRIPRNAIARQED